MKTCLLCGTVATDGEPTCSACGEASFDVGDMAAVTAGVVKTEEPADEPAVPSVKSGRKK